jgi:Xaa-Pro dipeptidase
MNRTALVEQLDRYGLDAVVASTPENVGYLTGFWMAIHNVARWLENYCLMSGSGKPALTAPLYGLVSHADSIEPDALDIHPHGAFYIRDSNAISEADRKIQKIMALEKSRSAVEALINVIKNRNLEKAVIGVENLLPLQAFERLKTELPGLKLKIVPEFFHLVRMIKNAEEIEKLSHSADIVEDSIDAALLHFEPGISEMEAAAGIRREMVDRGAAPDFTVVQFGMNTSHVDAQPTENRLKQGDLIHVDAGCDYQHYHSDTARSVVFGGQPLPKMQKYFSAIVQAQYRGIELAKPGVRASQIFEAMLLEMRKGIPHANRSNTGHGIGLEIWEQPYIVPGNDIVLEEGMAVNLEVPYSELGFGGLQVEDTLVITGSGHNLLTRVDKELVV